MLLYSAILQVWHLQGCATLQRYTASVASAGTLHYRALLQMGQHAPAGQSACDLACPAVK